MSGRLPPGSRTAIELESSGRFVEPIGTAARTNADRGLDGELWNYVSGSTVIQQIYSFALGQWITLLVSGAVGDHDLLSGVSPNDHHNENHAARHASGAADELSHDTIAGVSADDHHTENHASRHLLGGADHLNIPIAVVYVKAGTLVTGALNIRIHAPRAFTIANVTAAAVTAPTGATLIVDVNKNGTTIFTTQANRPTIAIAGTEDLTSVPDVVTVAADDVLTVDIDQIGSTIAGADLVVQIRGIG